MQANEILIHPRGDAFNFAFEVEGKDFTGLSVKSHFRMEVDQDTPDMIFQTSDGSISVNIISTVKAIITLVKDSTYMANKPEGIYNYDIETFTTTSDIETICYGKLEIVKDITR